MSSLWSELFDGSVVGSSSCITFCRQNKTVVLACLPVMLSELAGLSNFDEMFKLVDRCGGRKIYLPRTSPGFYELSGVRMQEEKYQHWKRLAQLSGQIEVSSRWGVFLALRRAAIYLAMKNGTDTNDIVTSFGITQRQLRTLRAKLR